MEPFEEGMSIYCALIAEPATGKSPTLKILRKSLTAIEEYFNVNYENSNLVNGNLLNT